MQLKTPLWIALIFVTPCLSQTLTPRFPSPYPASPTGIETQIPFKLYADYLIVVKGTLGNLTERNFLIDTGANPSSIDRRVARKLGLSGRSRKLALYGQDIDVEGVVLPHLVAGPIEVEFLDVLVQDLAPIEHRLSVRIDAIIGFDILSRTSFAINYSSRRISFGSFENTPQTIPFSSAPPKVTVQVYLFDQSVHLLVDTGTPNVLLFEDRLPSRLRHLPTNTVSLSPNSAATLFQLREVMVPGVSLGETTLRPKGVFLTRGNASFDQCMDGVVGPTSLGLKWIAFDFEHQRFAWKR